MIRSSFVLTSALLLVTSASAQGTATTSPSLTQAITLAYQQGPDLASAQTSLEDAQTTLRAKKSDPSAVVLDVTEAQQAYDLAKAKVNATRVNVMQNVVNAYLTLFETQQNISLYKAQANLDAKSVQVAQAKLSARSGTSLDVSKAQNTLSTTQQNLSNATAQLSVQSNTLAKLFGQSSGTITAKAPSTPPTLKTSLTVLNQNLSDRLTSVIQAQQAVELARLNVNLSNNDYTPRLTLEAAQSKVKNAQRDLANAQKSASTSLTDAYRAAQDAYERIAIEQQDLRNAQTTLTQAQARYKSGVISQVELQTQQVTVQSAQYALTQATDSYWKALASLSVASEVDVTELVGSAK